MPHKAGSEMKVGLVLLAALAVVASAIFLIGEENRIFRRKNDYFIRFESVSGLNSGNPVQLNGVYVGTVQDVVLPQDPKETQIQVWIHVDRRYAARIRGDSEASIKTLGLLGDKYVEISSGTPATPEVASGHEITAAPTTNVDELMASGEDMLDNVTAISISLRNILERMERGEGLLGELVTDAESGQHISDSLLATLQSIQRLARSLESGEGLVPRLIHDPALAERLDASLDRLDGILARAESGEGLLPALLNDAGARQRFEESLDRLSTTLAHLEALTQDLEQGQGLLPRMLHDEELAEQITTDLKETLHRLNTLSSKLTEGDGTVAQLLNDPEIYQSLNDILVGIDESWMLRWLIRNRQKKGIEVRYKEEQSRPPSPAPPTSPESPSGGTTKEGSGPN